MHLRLTAGVAAAVIAMSATSDAQSGRTATLPSAPRAPAEVPVIVLRDGSVVANFGRGYERLIRSCAAYTGNRWPGGQPHQRGAHPWPQGGSASPAPQGGSAPPAPQGGSASRPPGANGLPPAPGLSPVSGSKARSRVGTSRATDQRVGVGSVGSNSLERPNSGWRSAGPAYYDGACYTHDRYGRLRLIRL